MSSLALASLRLGFRQVMAFFIMAARLPRILPFGALSSVSDQDRFLDKVRSTVIGDFPLSDRGQSEGSLQSTPRLVP